MKKHTKKVIAPIVITVLVMLILSSICGSAGLQVMKYHLL